MTEEKETREETDLVRRHNELILAAAGEGIFGLDTQGRTTFVNPAAVDLSGWGREEMIGRRQHDVNEVVEEAGKLALVGARDINIEVEFNFGSDLPQVLVDKIQIQQVVVNLVRNGVEALTDSKVRKLSISTAATEGDGVEVTVCDSGPGVTKEISGRLFQSFVTTKAQGMGLGLSICRSIVEDHGGRLSAERNQERGMTFRFTIPISPPDEESPG